MTIELTDQTTDTAAALQAATIRVTELEAKVAEVRTAGKQPSGGLKKTLREARADVEGLAYRLRIEREAAQPAPAPEPAQLDEVNHHLPELEAEEREATRRERGRRRRQATLEAQAAAPAPAVATEPKQRGKLSMADAVAIVQAVDGGAKRRALADQYGVHVSTVADILVGRYLKGAVQAARNSTAA